MAFIPAVDGTDVGMPALPLDSIRKGKFNKVPTIIGSNKDEGTLLGLDPFIGGGFAFGVNAKTLNQSIAHFFGEANVAPVLAMYPAAELDTAWDHHAVSGSTHTHTSPPVPRKEEPSNGAISAAMTALRA